MMMKNTATSNTFRIAFNFIFSAHFFSFSIFSVARVPFVPFGHFTFCQLTKAFGCCNTRETLSQFLSENIILWASGRTTGVWWLVVTATTASTTTTTKVQSNYTSFLVRHFFASSLFHFVVLIVSGLRLNFRSSRFEEGAHTEKKALTLARRRPTSKILCILGLASCIYAHGANGRYGPMLVTAHWPCIT